MAVNKRKRSGGNEGANTAPAPPPAKQKVSKAEKASGVAAAPACLTLAEFTRIHRFLHSEGTTLHLARFHEGLEAGTARWGKRKVVLPRGMGEVSIVDDRITKTTAYAGRARAGGAISWWRTSGKGTPWKFCGKYSATLESRTPAGPVTVSQLGRWPAVKGAPRAPVEDEPGTMTLGDASCMAVASPTDPCFVPKPVTAKGAAPATVVELAKRPSRCAVCGARGTKGIAAGEVRFRYKSGRYGRMIHARCATKEHLPSKDHLEQCVGFDTLTAEQQEELRGLGCFVAAALL